MIKGVSFSIQEGEFVGIMGPSGSGKRQLLNVISTLDKARAGLLKLGYDNYEKWSRWNFWISVTKIKEIHFQDFNLLENLSI